MHCHSFKYLQLQKTALTSYSRCYFSTRPNFLIETNEVQDLIAMNSPKLRIINASWYMPGSEIDAKAQHLQGRLTSTTQYFSISEVVEPGSPLPNTMPNSEVFTQHMKNLRIAKDHQIVCYDHVGMFSVARCAFMLRFFGAANVRIMNGGLQKWLNEGRTVYSGPYTPGEGLLTDGDYNYRPLDPSRVIMDVAKIHEIVGKIYRGSKEWQITDARSAARFNGEAEESRTNQRKSVRAGHITGSINVPYSSYIEAETGCLKSDEELRKLFVSKGLDLKKNTVHSCGSGVTACIADLAWNICGGKPAAMYDGSWAEYVRIFLNLV